MIRFKDEFEFSHLTTPWREVCLAMLAPFAESPSRLFDYHRAYPNGL